MAPTVRQTNFSGGELAPLYWGRTDLPVHARGLRICRNFMVTKSGAAMSRPGTKFVAEVKAIAAYDGVLPGVTPPRPVRLVPFVFSDDVTYVLEFGERYIRFHKLGATILSAGVPYTLTTYVDASGATVQLPFTASSVWSLRFAQVGNTITIAAQYMPALELRRNGDADWACTATSFAPPAPALPDIGVSAMPNPFNPGTAPQVLTTTPFMIDQATLVAADPSHPKREWIYGFTAIMKRVSDGVVLESAFTVVKYKTDAVEHLGKDSDPIVQTLLTDHQVVCYADKPVRLVRLGESFTSATVAYETLSFRVYKGAGDVFGWIGDTRTREFIDNGIEPDFDIQPPLGSDPFKVPFPPFAAALSPPWSVAFFQNRRVFGGAGVNGANNLKRGGFIFASAVDDYYNFDDRIATHVSGEALVFELAARRREEIRHLIGLERLVVLTNSSVWTIGGQTGSPLDFDSVDARQNDDVGSSNVTPVVIDGTVLFVRTKGSGARALVPAEAATPYQGVNISEVASHLFVGNEKAIVDWCYAEDPWGVVWAVREDGQLLSLTFERGQMNAWARHDTDGTFEAICSVPEGEEDAVYAVVKRFIKGDAAGQDVEEVRTIERFTSRVRRVLEADPDPTWVGAPTAGDTETLYPTDVCLDCVLTYAGAPVGTLTGLGRHAFKTVYVVARGMPVTSGVVDADGNLDLGLGTELPAVNAKNAAGVPIFVAHVGLLFTPELETLDIAGEARLRKKTIARAGFEVDNARGLSVGQDLNHLKMWRQRQVQDDYNPISAATALVDTPVASTWDQSARVALRQTLPLPVTVVGITRELALDEG
jgi:hypothetical protein